MPPSADAGSGREQMARMPSRRELLCARMNSGGGSAAGGTSMAPGGRDDVRRVLWAVVVRGPRGVLLGVIGFFATRAAAWTYVRDRHFSGAVVLPAMPAGVGLAR
ncbi:hypothetical protein [Frankia sp. ACN1ag]|uniref:hypothetical protein n=1 Tax=Frankia sp. ACN1ag TaxID=102891 RepID=UPI00128EB5F2|nr:hypothetical protein [Frankia sp. ACN1ag]